MKKILIFSLAYYPKHVGGAEVAIKNITDRIAPSDIEFHMVTLRFDSTLPKIEKMGSVLVHRIGFTTPNPSMADLKKFPLHLNKHLFQLLAAWKALALHKEHRYDAIWAVMAHSAGIPAVIFKSFHPSVPYMLTLQEGDPPEKIERMARPVWPLFKRAFTKADVLQPISNFLNEWGKRMGFSGYSALIPNAVDIKHFSKIYPEKDVEEFREEIGKKESDVMLIGASRFIYKNGADDVHRALALMPKNIKFLADGDGPDLDALERLADELALPSVFLVYASDVEASKLEPLAQELSLREVRFFPVRNHPRGFTLAVRGRGPDLRLLKRETLERGLKVGMTLPAKGCPTEKLKKLDGEARVIFFVQTGQEEMPKHLKACDIAIRPSRSEGMGNSFIEAMVAGLPVIGTPVGGIPDFLFDPDKTAGKEATGFLCEPNSPKSIAETVERVLSNPERTKRIARHAQESASKKYDWDIIAKDMREKAFARLFREK